jgi:hypothetical protein
MAFRPYFRVSLAQQNKVELNRVCRRENEEEGRMISISGNLAILKLRPMAFRPYFTIGLAQQIKFKISFFIYFHYNLI